MAERRNADHGLVDAWTAELGGPRTAALLTRLDRAVAWAAMVRPIAALPEYRARPAHEDKGGRPAWPALVKLNRLIARVHAAVEHPFAWMKNWGYRRVRYRGRRRNEVDFALNLIAYNWKWSLSLAKA